MAGRLGVVGSGPVFRVTGIGCTASSGDNLTGHHGNGTGRPVIDGSAMTVGAPHRPASIQAGDPADLDAPHAITPHRTIQVS